MREFVRKKPVEDPDRAAEEIKRKLAAARAGSTTTEATPEEIIVPLEDILAAKTSRGTPDEVRTLDLDNYGRTTEGTGIKELEDTLEHPAPGREDESEMMARIHDSIMSLSNEVPEEKPREIRLPPRTETGVVGARAKDIITTKRNIEDRNAQNRAKVKLETLLREFPGVELSKEERDAVINFLKIIEVEKNRIEELRKELAEAEKLQEIN